MNHVKSASLLLLLSFSWNCGRQVVEFPLDGAIDSGRDLRADVPPDVQAGSDVRPGPDGQPGPDVQPGSDAQPGPDVQPGSDAQPGPDGQPRVDAPLSMDLVPAPDRNPDTSAPDAGVDAQPDRAVDAPVEAGPDAVMDSGSDLFEAGPDVGAPLTVISTTPGAPALDVSINQRPTATFSKPMNGATLTDMTFTVTRGLQAVAGFVTFDPQTNTATFTPTVPLEVNTMFTATITTGAKDLGGGALAMNHQWSFTTAACSQGPVALGAAAGFAVLAGSTVTNTGPTSVTGDLGVSPGTAVTGFPVGIIIGAKHAGDPAAALGIASLTTAYNDAKGRTLCPVTVAGNLGGMTLYPGLYKSTSSLEISSGDLTLDAKGEGDAVFIFQMASTLTTTPGRQVILTNNAKSANVYWQVGTSATFGSTSAMKGTVMADQAITMNTGATLNGRILARIAAVALDSNTIVKPTP